MKSIVIPKLDLKGKNFEVVVPSSKSLANRALILAALSKGDFQLEGDFEAEDIQLMVNALGIIGIGVKCENGGIHVQNDLAWMNDERDLELSLGNSGTSIRFLTSLVLLRKGTTVLTGKERLKERPIGDLVDALLQLGAEIEYLEKHGFPPLRVHGLKKKTGGKVSIRGDVSSQFLTSLILIGTSFKNPLEIVLEGKLISRPYVEMTIDLMRRWDVFVQNSSEGFRIFPQVLAGMDFQVEGDASAATYWWAIEYLHDCVINVQNVQNDSSQGDVQFKKVLNMLKTSKDEFSIDMNDMPDAAMTLMAVAPFHSGSVLIKNVASLRVKETDRIEAMANEMRKCGVQVETGEDWVRIHGFRLSVSRLETDNGERFLADSRSTLYDTSGATVSRSTIRIDTYDDHRIAMSMAVFASRLGNIEILDPNCVNKTYPKFWEHLKMLY